MKNYKSILYKAIIMIIIMTGLCGIIYPLIVTGISKMFFNNEANGSIIEVGGVKYGSELLGQQYTGNEYLWGRIMYIDTDTFTDEEGSAVVYAWPSNISPASDQYEKLIEERVEKIKEANPNADVDEIPVDLVTCSGSGLDPGISIAAAEYQIPRIAMQRNMSEEDVQKIIDKYTTGKLFGTFGEKVVNVLKVNLVLDGILE